MLTVKNISAKIIGLGIERILPGQTVALPKEYGESHPTIKFYLDRGWLAKSSGGGVLVPNDAKLDGGQAMPPEAGGDKAPEKNESDGDGDKAPEKNESGQKIPSKRDLSRMKLEELTKLAGEKGLQVSFNSTKDAVAELLIASFESE